MDYFLSYYIVVHLHNNSDVLVEYMQKLAGLLLFLPPYWLG